MVNILHLFMYSSISLEIFRKYSVMLQALYFVLEVNYQRRTPFPHEVKGSRTIGKEVENDLLALVLQKKSNHVPQLALENRNRLEEEDLPRAKSERTSHLCRIFISEDAQLWFIKPFHNYYQKSPCCG